MIIPDVNLLVYATENRNTHRRAVVQPAGVGLSDEQPAKLPDLIGNRLERASTRRPSRLDGTLRVEKGEIFGDQLGMGRLEFACRHVGEVPAFRLQCRNESTDGTVGIAERNSPRDESLGEIETDDPR